MIVQCLQMNGNQSVTLNTCTGENNQKWILGTPNNPTTEDLEAKEPLLLQHHQFIEDQSVNNENVIENELKRIYCNNLKTAQYTTALLAESSGILAAQANNLDMCNRLKPMGDSFIIQKCNVINITVSAKETSCGYEPFFNNQTIGRDGYSLHPFRECFWEDGLVNFNGKTFMWKKEVNDWIFVHPTHHRSALRLAIKFNEINDIEANYQLNHHEYYQRQEVERTNAINELITRIHISNSDSRTTYADNQSSESRFGTFTIWHNIRKGLIATIAIMFTLILIILTIITFLRARTLQTRRRFERYADQLEKNRRLLLKDTLERKRAEGQ